MSVNLIRFLQLQRERATRRRKDELRYRGVLYTHKYMPQQSKKMKASVTKLSPGEEPAMFKRCGHCGTKKAQCRKQKKCLKGLL